MLAGVVEYPPRTRSACINSAFGRWHPLLRCRWPRAFGTRRLFAMFGRSAAALGFAAIAAFAWACGAPLLLAIASPLVLWLLDPIRWGFNYPILLLGAPHTYGMVACRAAGDLDARRGTRAARRLPPRHGARDPSVARVLGRRRHGPASAPRSRWTRAQLARTRRRRRVRRGRGRDQSGRARGGPDARSAGGSGRGEPPHGRVHARLDLAYRRRGAAVPWSASCWRSVCCSRSSGACARHAPAGGCCCCGSTQCARCSASPSRCCASRLSR